MTNKQKRQKALGLLSTGLSRKEISKQVPCTEKTLRKWIKEQELPFKKKTALILYQSKEFNQKEIARKVGVTENTIGKWFKELKQTDGLAKENINLMQKRLNDLLKSSSSNPKDIRIIASSIQLLKP